MHLDIAVVRFNPDGDGISVMYVDGKEVMQGDYYHNKIDDRIEAWIEGGNFAGATCRLRYASVAQEPNEDEDWVEYTSAPATLQECEALPLFTWNE